MSLIDKCPQVTRFALGVEVAGSRESLGSVESGVGWREWIFCCVRRRELVGSGSRGGFMRPLRCVWARLDFVAVQVGCFVESFLSSHPWFVCGCCCG